MTDITRTAKLSECGQYRYALTRTWDAKAGEALFVMLNPSIADGLRDDPTIRKCMGFARQWALGGIRVANMFAYRATDPKDLHRAYKRGVEIVGPENIEHMLALVQGANRVVVAWGAHAEAHSARAEDMLGVLDRATHSRLWCLGISKGGQPLHPLMLRYTTPLQDLKDIL